MSYFCSPYISCFKFSCLSVWLLWRFLYLKEASLDLALLLFFFIAQVSSLCWTFSLSRGGGSARCCYLAPHEPSPSLWKLSWNHSFPGSLYTWLPALWRQELSFNHCCIIRNWHCLWRRLSTNKYILNGLGMKTPISYNLHILIYWNDLTLFRLQREALGRRGREGDIRKAVAVRALD